MKYRFRTAVGSAAPLVAAALAAALLVSSCAEIDLLKALRARMADADYIYVSADGSDDNTGISPDSPFATIQRGLAVAESADAYEVRVAEGEYVVETEADIIEVPEDVVLKGGWSADFGAWAPRTYVTTIAQGDGDASVLVSCTIDDDGYDDCFQTSYIDGFTFLAAGIPALYAERRMTMRNCVVTVAQTGDFVSAVQLQGDGDDSCGGGHNLTNNIIRTDGDTGVLVPAGCDLDMRCNTIIAENRAIYFEAPGNESSLYIKANILGSSGSGDTALLVEHSGDGYFWDNLIFGYGGVFSNVGNITMDMGDNDSHDATIAGDVFMSGLDTDLSDGDDTDYHLHDSSQLYAVDHWGGGDGSVRVDFEGDPRPYPEGGDYDRGADEKVP